MGWRPFHKPDRVTEYNPVQTTGGPDMLEARTFASTWKHTEPGELSLWRVCVVVALAAFALGLLCSCTTSLDLTTDGLKAESAPAGDCGK